MSALPVIAPTHGRPHQRPGARSWTPRIVTDADGAGVRDDGHHSARGDASGGGRVPPGRDARGLAPPTRASAWRRRLAALAVLALLVAALTVAIGRMAAADAGPTDPVGGTVTITPGDTLWAVAAATAPDGVDPREQLARIMQLNGFERSDVAAWTVVLLPADGHR